AAAAASRTHCCEIHTWLQASERRPAPRPASRSPTSPSPPSPDATTWNALKLSASTRVAAPVARSTCTYMPGNLVRDWFRGLLRRADPAAAHRQDVRGRGHAAVAAARGRGLVRHRARDRVRLGSQRAAL